MKETGEKNLEDKLSITWRRYRELRKKKKNVKIRGNKTR